MDLFDWQHAPLCPEGSELAQPWRILQRLAERIDALGAALGGEYMRAGEHIWVHRSAQVSASAVLGEHCIVGEGTQIRHAAFVRGNALIGARCVVGNGTEVKNAVLFDGVCVPHFNYVGDSILGYRTHLGAGAIASNVRMDRGEIGLCAPFGALETGMRKLGALVGDLAEIGCNSVLNPGSVIGRAARVYPLSSVHGYVPPRHIYRSSREIVPIRG